MGFSKNVFADSLSCFWPYGLSPGKWRSSPRGRLGPEHEDTRSFKPSVESSWNVMAHGDAREGKWRGNRQMEWVASTLHTTSEHGVSSITTADAHTSAASSRLNWRPGRFKWTYPFRWKTKSGFCACAITFQTQSNNKALIYSCFVHRSYHVICRRMLAFCVIKMPCSVRW